MTKYKGKKFIASYSGGKDSVLALYRAIKQGMLPLSLITTYNTDEGRTWFHGIPKPLLLNVSKALEIPVKIVKTNGSEYAVNFEKALCEFRDAGAKVCVFGDIDIEEHLQWCTQRCCNAGIEPYSPLWKESRRQLVYEFIDSGFIANITVVDTKQMKDKHLGSILTKKVADSIDAQGADVCGENGEYHTFVSDGPIFQNAVEFSFKEKIRIGNYSILPLDYPAV